MSDERKISDRYRELPREEPPRALDDAILAASRRAVKGRNRWYVPLAAAAIIVLAVAVTVHVERERPNEEIATSVEPAKQGLPTEPAVEKAPAVSETARKAERTPERQDQYAPEPKPAPPPPQLGSRGVQEQRAADAAEAPRAPAPPPALQQERALDRARESASADRREKTEALAKRADEAKAQSRQGEAVRERPEVMASAAAPASRFARAAPEQWLLAIDDLKRQGKHDEAARELAEFRKRYPSYRIPEAISEKFERR